MIKKKDILLTIVLIIFVTNSPLIIKSVLDSSNIFFNNIFVSIFPFIILSDILIYFDYHIFLSNLFGKLISKIFKISKNSSIVILLSILSSSPSNSIYLKNLLDNKIINENESNRVLLMTYFPSIMFVLGTVGIKLYNSFKIGLYLLISNYIYNFIIGIFTRKNITIKNELNIEKKEEFFVTLKNSIIKSINTCFIILGNITIFLIIINLLNKYITINPVISSIFSGLLEITTGIINISRLNIDLNIKIALTSFILNFSGLSIIFQSTSIMSPYKTNIKKIIIIKLLFSLLISFIIYLMF